MSWTMNGAGPLASLWMTKKLGVVADKPEGRAAIQRDLGRLEKWANRSLIEFNKGK